MDTKDKEEMVGYVFTLLEPLEMKQLRQIQKRCVELINRVGKGRFSDFKNGQKVKVVRSNGQIAFFGVIKRKLKKNIVVEHIKTKLRYRVNPTLLYPVSSTEGL